MTLRTDPRKKNYPGQHAQQHPRYATLLGGGAAPQIASAIFRAPFFHLLEKKGESECLPWLVSARQSVG